MYCISKDKNRLVNTDRFSINKVPGAIKYNQDRSGDVHESYYCIVADSMYMEVFETEEEAKAKLLKVLKALSEDTEIFEF